MLLVPRAIFLSSVPGGVRTVPPPVALRLPEREHVLEDVAGERALRRGGGVDLRGPGPAARIRPVRRRPGEDADEEVVLLAIDNARRSHARVDLPEPRRGAALGASTLNSLGESNLWPVWGLSWTRGHRGAAFVTAVTSRVFQ